MHVSLGLPPKPKSKEFNIKLKKSVKKGPNSVILGQLSWTHQHIAGSTCTHLASILCIMMNQSLSAT